MRLNIVLAVALVSSACATPSPVTPSSGPWRFSGTVSAMDGARMSGPIAGAELRVVSGANVDARTTSDAAGHYVFADLESGKFTVKIAAPGYVSATPIVSLYRDTEANFALTPQ